jgi:hypothetical protein
MSGYKPYNQYGRQSDDRNREREEVYSKRVPAGKRTYFFDVKSTRSGEDFFLTITESKRVSEEGYEKHKIFLYKEDFGKFVNALHDVVEFVREKMPDADFRDLPEKLVVTSNEIHHDGIDFNDDVFSDDFLSDTDLG